MKFNLKKFLLLFVFFSISSFTPSLCEKCEFEEFDFDDLDFSEFSLDDSGDNSNLQTREGDEKDILEKILEVAGSIKTPLWKHTKPPKGRDVLYLIPHKLSSLEYGGINLNIFFNNTDKMSFSPDETLKLSEEKDTFDALVKALITTLPASEASSVIPLFKKLTIQERKVGGLLQAGFTTGPYTFQLNTSLLASERNFWLSKKDQENIKTLFSQPANRSGQETGYSFSTKDLYKIKFGMGDTRLKAGLNTLNMSNFQLDVGFEGIIPTSIISNIPRLKSYEINFEDFQTSIVEVLNSIRDNLITPRLGNGGHFGLGCYAESRADLFHDSIHLWNRISFDNLFAAQEDRLIPSKQTMPSPADDPIYFITEILGPLIDPKNPNPVPATEFIKQYIFPPPYRVNLNPGGIFNFVLNVTFDLGRKWRFGLGYDYYMQQKERFEDICYPKVDPSTLRISDAEGDRAAQHKIFTEVNYIKKQRNWNLIFGLGGDYTISSVNMGHDWTLFLRLGASF